MSELLPCPFCGGEVEHQLMWDGAYSFTCRQCGLNARFTDDIARAVPEMIEGTEKKWNTRYERTCHITEHWDVENSDTMLVLSCGHEAIEQFGGEPVCYCPICGAKAVDE